MAATEAGATGGSDEPQRDLPRGPGPRRRASDLSLDEISAATGIPVNELRDRVLGGGDAEVEIRDAYRVYRALYPDDPLRFHEWFDEPQSLMPDELDTSTYRGETECRASAGSAQEE